MRARGRTKGAINQLLCYNMVSSKLNATELHWVFTVHWLAKLFCATEIPARIMCLSLCLAACSRTWHTCAFWRRFRCSMHSTRELSCPRKHWGNTQQGFICSHTFTKNDSSICTRSKRWPTNFKQKRILWWTSTKCSQAQFWRNDYSASKSILTRLAQLLSNMLKHVCRETFNVAHACWCQFQWCALCTLELSWQYCSSKGC